MDDLISRKAAIDAIAYMHCESDEDGYVWIIRRDVWARIEALPSAQRRGYWIDLNGGGCCCSECGKYALDEIDGNYIHVASKTNYCPHCGADMTKREENEWFD